MTIDEFCKHADDYIHTDEFLEQLHDHYLALIQSDAASDDPETAADAKDTLENYGGNEYGWALNCSVTPTAVRNLVAAMFNSDQMSQRFLLLLENESLKVGGFWDETVWAMCLNGGLRRVVDGNAAIDPDNLTAEERARWKTEVPAMQSAAAKVLTGLSEHFGIIIQAIDETAGAECTDPLSFALLAYALRRNRGLLADFYKVAKNTND